MVQLRSLPGHGSVVAQRRLRPHEWLDDQQRRLRTRAIETALANGAAPSVDSITVVLASRAWCDEFAPGVWTAEIVRQLLWLDIGIWCGEFDVELPDDITLALWAVVTAAHEDGLLAPGSDDIDQLVGPLADSGGFTPPGRGRRRRRAG